MPTRPPRKIKPEYKRKPVDTCGLKLDKLSFGTLRRYQYFFGLDKQKDRAFINNREELIESIEEHFANELKINHVDVIYKFLSTKKDPDMGNQTGNYELRNQKTRMTRNTNF